jgi:hypothetical protein
MAESNSSGKSPTCQHRPHSRRASFFGDALQEDGCVIYCAPVMRDLRVKVPLTPSNDDTRLPLRRYLNDNPETDLILCIQDTESIRQFAESVENVEWVPMETGYQLIIVGNRVFIDQGTLTSTGLEQRERSNLCRHGYSTAREFLTKELDVELE